MYRKGLKILETTIGIESNREELLPSFPLKTEVKSLLTDFKEVKGIPYSLDLDGNIFAEAIQIDITSKRECPGDTFSSKKEVSK